MEAKEQIILIDFVYVSQGVCNFLTATPGCAVGRSRPRFFRGKCNSGVRIDHLQRRDCDCPQRGNTRRRRECLDIGVQTSQLTSRPSDSYQSLVQFFGLRHMSS